MQYCRVGRNKRLDERLSARIQRTKCAAQAEKARKPHESILVECQRSIDDHVATLMKVGNVSGGNIDHRTKRIFRREDLYHTITSNTMGDVQERPKRPGGGIHGTDEMSVALLVTCATKTGFLKRDELMVWKNLSVE